MCRFVWRLIIMVALLTPLVSVAKNPDNSRLIEFSGKALDINTRQLLYIERHQIQLDRRDNYVQGKVDYLTPEGDIFASKTLDFEFSDFAPKVSFTDSRIDQQIEIDYRNKVTSLLVSRNGNPLIDKSLKVSDEVVIDAGFDRFIYQHWEKIVAGNALDFPFLAQTRGTFFDFEVVKKSESDQQVVMLVQASNMFLRWLMNPIELVYEKATRRLSSYTGITNIQRVDAGVAAEEYYIAEIHYEYKIPH